AGIGDATEPLALEHGGARRREQSGGDAPRAQRERGLLLAADDNGRDVFVRRETVFLQDRLGQEIDRAAARRDADDLAAQLLGGADPRLRHEIELRLGRANEDELHRNAAHRRRDRRAGGGCVIDRSADERLQTDGAADQDRFDIEPFVAVETFYVGDPERRLGDRDRADREAYFFTLREERRCCE